MRTVVEAVPDRREFLYEWQDEGPGRLFEDIFTVKNLITEELELYWRDDITSLKFINLFPNCKKLHLSLVRSLACAESASFVVEFPLLHKLQEVSLGLNIKSPDFNFSNIQIGPTLHKCELNYDFQSKPNPLSVAKFVENNPNIRVMILIRGFVPEILSVLTRGLKNLTYLQILSPALIVMSQENANDICDCLSLKDIELDHVPETLLKQLTKRFHRDAGRPKQDLYVAKIQEGFPLFHIKVFKDAAASK